MIPEEKKKELRNNILGMMIVLYIVAILYSFPLFLEEFILQGWILLIICFSIITGTLVPIFF